MKFSAIVQETYTAAGEFKWYWNVFPSDNPDNFIDGTTPGRVSAKIAADQAEILEGFTPVSNEFYVRKVFNCEYDEAEVEYEV